MPDAGDRSRSACPPGSSACSARHREHGPLAFATEATAEHARAHAYVALEHLRERILRRIADALRDLRGAEPLPAHEIGRGVHAPAGHVARGWLTQELAEALEE